MRTLLALLLAASAAAAAPVPPLSEALAVQDAFRKAAANAKPAVVSIDTVFRERARPLPFLYGDPQEFLRRFFGQGQNAPDEKPRPRWRRATGVGSGVITDPRGYILTNEHVVGGAEEIEVIVRDPDEKTYKGKIVGTDPTTDIAVVKIEPKDGPFPHLELGDSDKVQIGDWAIAVGSPFGLEQTLTVGVISALRQSIQVENRDYSDFFQTDAAINQGNSGGPLLNIQGQVIGVNTAIFSPSGVSAGIGFAIPSNQAARIMKELISSGRIVRGWAGVEIVALNPVLARQFKVPGEKGALVNSVLPDSPASKAGLLRGDVIVEFDGKTIASPHDLIALVEELPPGKKADLKLIRDGRERNFEMTLGERPAKLARAGGRERPGGEEEGGATWEGAHLRSSDEVLKERFGLPPSASGAVVTGVDEGSVADQMGMETGDLIKSIDGRPVKDVPDFLKAAKSASIAKGVVLDVDRRGRRLYLSFQQNP